MKIFKILLVSSLFGLISCNEFLDVNQDPNLPHEIPYNVAFEYTTSSICWELGSFYHLAGGYWSQFYASSNTANRHLDLEKYTLVNDYWDLINPYQSWTNIYTCGLYDLQYQILKAEREKEWNYFSAMTLFQAYTFQLMVDFYGEIPYFDVLDPEIKTDSDFHPAFDDGELIYRDLIKRIDLALEKLNANEYSKPLENDPFFNGDMSLWKEFGYTLKLKILLRMCYVDEDYSKQQIQDMIQHDAQFLSADAAFDFSKPIRFIRSDIKQEMNPLYYYEVYHISVRGIRLSTTLFNYLKENLDVRLNYISGGSISGDTISQLTGMPQGGCFLSTSQLNPAKISFIRLIQNDPVYLFSAVESNLLQAEAALRGWGNGNAKELYDSAVNLDFERKGYIDVAGDYLNAGGVYEYPQGKSFEEQLKAIMMAKWTALAGTQNAEAFFELNRTGYPEISAEPAWENGGYNPNYLGGKLTYSLSGETGGLFPKRLPIPPEEVRLNSSIDSSKKITERVWWDAKLK